MTATHTNLVTGGRVRNVLPDADAFDVDCVNAYTHQIDETNPIARLMPITSGLLASDDEFMAADILTVDYIPANLPA